MIIVANLRIAGLFRLIGAGVLRSVATKKQLLFAVILASGVLSAVCINDVVCLLFSPIVLLICRRAECDPRPYLIGVAVAANVGSAATFLGNPQNILIASLSHVSFLSYFKSAAPVALAGLFASFAIISALYRRELEGKVAVPEGLKPRYHRYLVIKSLIVLGLVVSGYLAGLDLALTSSLGAAVLLLTRRVKPHKVYASVDFNLLVMFIGLFILVGGVERSGLMAWLTAKLSFVDLSRPLAFTALTVGLSNVISNVPAVLLLKSFLPAGNPAAWWKALALFSTFAGNLTLAGSVANLIVVETARREKVQISFMDYFKVGLPVTAITTGLGLVWLFH